MILIGKVNKNCTDERYSIRPVICRDALMACVRLFVNGVHQGGESDPGNEGHYLNACPASPVVYSACRHRFLQCTQALQISASGRQIAASRSTQAAGKNETVLPSQDFSIFLFRLSTIKNWLHFRRWETFFSLKRGDWGLFWKTYPLLAFIRISKFVENIVVTRTYNYIELLA